MNSSSWGSVKRNIDALVDCCFDLGKNRWLFCEWVASLEGCDVINSSLVLPRLGWKPARQAEAGRFATGLTGPILGKSRGSSSRDLTRVATRSRLGLPVRPSLFNKTEISRNSITIPPTAPPPTAVPPTAPFSQQTERRHLRRHHMHIRQ